MYNIVSLTSKGLSDSRLTVADRRAFNRIKGHVVEEDVKMKQNADYVKAQERSLNRVSLRRSDSSLLYGYLPRESQLTNRTMSRWDRVQAPSSPASVRVTEVGYNNSRTPSAGESRALDLKSLPREEAPACLQSHRSREKAVVARPFTVVLDLSKVEFGEPMTTVRSGGRLWDKK